MKKQVVGDFTQLETEIEKLEQRLDKGEITECEFMAQVKNVVVRVHIGDWTWEFGLGVRRNRL